MVTIAPAVMPSAINRSPRPASVSLTPWTSACAPTRRVDSGTALEVNVKSVQDIIQPGSRPNRDGGDDRDDRETHFEAALADHDQEVGDARHEQRHHRQ